MGFFDRLANAWKIFKLSFSLLKRDKSLIIIPILTGLSLILIMYPFIISLLLHLKGIETDIYFQNQSLKLLLFIFIFLSLFIFYLWNIFLASAQSWMIYEVLQGKNTTLISGFSRAFKNIFDILYFGINILVLSALTSLIKGKGKVGDAVGGTINYLAGIAGRLVIPAMIITERNFRESVIQLKESIKTIPEIATYEIGIRPLINLIFWVGIIICFVFGFILGFYIGVILFALLILLITAISNYINHTYYTLVYLTLIEKKKIKGLDLYIK